MRRYSVQVDDNGFVYPVEEILTENGELVDRHRTTGPSGWLTGFKALGDDGLGNRVVDYIREKNERETLIPAAVDRARKLATELSTPISTQP